MRLIITFIILIASFKINAQIIDTCSTPIHLRVHGYMWRFEIDTPKYNTPFEIKNEHGLFKLKIDSCLGKIDLELFDGDTLKEKGILQISPFLRVDSNFIEDEVGDLKAVPVYSFGAYKIGTWKYWAPDDYYIQKFDK